MPFYSDFQHYIRNYCVLGPITWQLHFVFRIKPCVSVLPAQVLSPLRRALWATIFTQMAPIVGPIILITIKVSLSNSLWQLICALRCT